jgi:hypothetical protein
MKLLNLKIITCRKCPLYKQCEEKGLNVASYSLSYSINPKCHLKEVLSSCCNSKLKKTKNKVYCCRNCKKEVSIE